MKVTKYGHCALLIEESGVRILTDPGSYSLSQVEARNLNAIVITHEHADHLHMDSLRILLKENPGVRVITNSGVGVILTKEGISFELMEDGVTGDVSGLKLEAMGNKHAEIYQNFGQVQNTGFFFGGRLFYPGDAFYIPKTRPEILALPVAGPWMKISEAMKYALEVRPKFAFPVHDGGVKQFGAAHLVPETFLVSEGIDFRPMKEGDGQDF